MVRPAERCPGYHQPLTRDVSISQDLRRRPGILARGHFRVRNLERKYGEEIIRKDYEGMAQAR